MTIPTTLEVNLNALERDYINRWAAGASGPCPVCGIEVLEGSDCPSQHFNQASSLTQQAGMSITLTKAVSILKARQ